MNKLVIWPVALVFLLPLAFPSSAFAEGADTASFDGVLLDEAGKPASGYPLALKTPDGQRVHMASTDDGGTFGLSGVPPGNYEVLVLPQDGGETPLASKKMTLAAGEKTRVEIRLTSDRPGAAGTEDSGGAGFSWKTIAIAVLEIGIGIVIGLYLGARYVKRA